MRNLIHGALAGVVLLTGGGAVPGQAVETSTPPSAAPPAQAGTHQHALAGHDTATGVTHLPAIDCPLRQAGINPAGLKPFEEVEQYIAFLERADRAAWQKPDEVVRALRLAGDEVVADLGAGSGYFTFRLARALPRGRVVALDSQPEMVRHIHHRLSQESIQNVETRVVAAKEPSLPRDADIVFICDVLHHVTDRSDWLDRVHAGMKDGARLVAIEFKAGDLPQGPPESVKIPKRDLIDALQQAGLVLVEDRADLLPYQDFLVFERRSALPPRTARSK